LGDTLELQTATNLQCASGQQYESAGGQPPQQVSIQSADVLIGGTNPGAAVMPHLPSPQGPGSIELDPVTLIGTPWTTWLVEDFFGAAEPT